MLSQEATAHEYSLSTSSSKLICKFQIQGPAPEKVIKPDISFAYAETSRQQHKGQ